MDMWKLFGGTFILIFLAELGDKTQLAAMAKTADSPDNMTAKWVVFLGASLALVASTFVAVFLGHILKAIVPDERYIKIAAALLFLIFGFTILYETIGSFRAAPAPEAAAAVTTASTAGTSAPRAAPSVREAGLAGELALRAAMDFESISVKRYRTLAGEASPELSSLLLELAAEEEGHLGYLRGMPPEQCEDAAWEPGASCAPSAYAPSNRLTAKKDNAEILAELIKSEEATADFYRQLSRRTLIPSVRTALSRLADEEAGHAKRLRELGEGKTIKA